LILKTTDGGQNWSQQTNGSYKQLSGVHFPAVDTGYAVGNTGTILKTVDGGNVWSPQTSGTTSLLRSVQFIDTDTGYTVGASGKILKTINGGQTWTSQISGTFNTLFSVYFIDAQNGIIVGDNGTILQTTNGGGNWIPQTSGTGNLLLYVHFIGNTGFAVGESGTILKTMLSVDLPELSQTTFSLYPNPTSNGFTLQSDQKLISNAVLYIYSRDGKQIQEEHFSSESPYTDIRNLENGLYLVELRWQNGSIRQRLIVNR
jgi:hypothetical protein